jgi:hypothetical protein
LEIMAGAAPAPIVVQETHRRRAVYDPWGLELAGIGYSLLEDRLVQDGGYMVKTGQVFKIAPFVKLLFQWRPS